MMDNDKVSYSKETTSMRPAAKKIGCENCGHKFKKWENFVVKETKVNWFRGDDEVEFLCAKCTPATILKQLKFKFVEPDKGKEKV